MNVAVCVSLAAGLAIARAAGADIIRVGPFSGELHEPLNQHFTTIVAQLPILGGAATLESVSCASKG
jgi:hypothetical protein